MKTITALRASFWEAHRQFAGQYRPRKRQNAYPCDTRAAWVDWVDHCHRAGLISDGLASRAIL